MRTIAAQWASYQASVVPKDAGPTQREECRRAFYAGAAAMLGITQTTADLTEDAGVAVLEGLHQECRAFIGTVR